MTRLNNYNKEMILPGIIDLYDIQYLNPPSVTLCGGILRCFEVSAEKLVFSMSFSLLRNGVASTVRKVGGTRPS